MVQTFYSLMAIVLLMLIVLNFNRAIHMNQQKMMLNEIATVVTSVGAEFLDEIGRYQYDPTTPTTLGALATLTNPAVLQNPASFGTGACDPDNDFSACLVINDFHGKAATRTVDRIYDGVTYVVPYSIDNIEVRYVSETPPHNPVAAGTKTFAKEVILTISSPEMYLGSRNNPLTVQMSRVYTYPNL